MEISDELNLRLIRIINTNPADERDETDIRHFYSVSQALFEFPVRIKELEEKIDIYKMADDLVERFRDVLLEEEMVEPDAMLRGDAIRAKQMADMTEELEVLKILFAANRKNNPDIEENYFRLN